MGHPQPPKPVATDNTAENSIMNGMEKRKISRATEMIFYWVRVRIRKNHSHIFWEEEKENLVDYITKHHPVWHHKTMRQIYLKPTKNT